MNTQAQLNSQGINSQGLGSKQNEQYSPKRLALLWGLIFCGYFLFVLQWYSIGNLSAGWGDAFYQGSVNPLISGATNWVITLGRAFGSIMAGWLIAKVGHKYAVVTVLGLMILSFPFLIVSQNEAWNSLSLAGGAQANQDNIAVAGFSLFIIFRIFLGIGGTTLITYTNSIIAKMNMTQRPKYMVANQFGFNAAAFFANIFFVIPGVAKEITDDPRIWTGLLAGFLVLILVLLILYLIYGVEVVPRESKKLLASAESQIKFTHVLKQSDTWKLCSLSAILIVSVIFINSSAMRTFIEQSPANFQALVIDNVVFSKMATSMSGSNSYFWVWPMFTCSFMLGLLVGAFWLGSFAKTIFERRNYVFTIVALGYVFMMISLLSGYFGGYANPFALAAMLIFICLSGACLWCVQPTILSIPQQMERSNAKYMGIVAGLIWGVGYLGYTVAEASLSSIASYVDVFKFANQINDSVQAIGSGLNFADAQDKFAQLDTSLIKTHETLGITLMIVLYWVILVAIFPIVYVLPKCGYRKQNGEFVLFTEKWSPFKLKMWNINNKQFQIASHLN